MARIVSIADVKAKISHLQRMQPQETGGHHGVKRGCRDFLRSINFRERFALPNLVDFELLDGVHHAIQIEPGATAAQPDDWDHLPAYERLHVTFADAEPPGHGLEVGEVIAVVRQSFISWNHRDRFGNGWLSVVGLVDVFRKFHVFLLCTGSENRQNCACSTEPLTGSGSIFHDRETSVYTRV